MSINKDDLWINKYRPKNIEDIIGNSETITKLENWLKTFNTNTNTSIVLSGGHGIGKTLITQLLLKKYNYVYKIIYPDEIKSYRTNMDFEDYYNFDNSIKSKVKMKSNNNKNLALVFDETESITLTSERKYVFNIHKINSKIKSFPLIFISNTNHSKLVNDLKKYCLEFKFMSPSSYELINYIKKICSCEKIKIMDLESIDMVIKFTQYDIRRLINVLQEYNYNFNTINIKDMSTFIERSISKDIDIGLYEASMSLINNTHDFMQIYKLYETDKVLIPLMINENYYKKILSSKNKSSNIDILNQMIHISDSLSLGDTIETSIYTDQNWYLQNIHGFYTCFNTSYWTNKSDKILTKTDMKFSADLNKTSLKNINKKNITNLEKIILNKSIEEIMALCKITNFLILNKKSDSIVNILKHYKKDFNIKDLELCLKIDKTVDFITLTTKDKKEITNKCFI
jgi:replication factor C subunit 1